MKSKRIIMLASALLALIFGNDLDRGEALPACLLFFFIENNKLRCVIANPTLRRHYHLSWHR